MSSLFFLKSKIPPRFDKPKKKGQTHFDWSLEVLRRSQTKKGYTVITLP